MEIKTEKPNIYDQLWDPQAYLRQYHSQEFITDDEEAIYQRLVAFLKRTGRTYKQALDVGCGPTVYLHTALAPYVGELHLADYVPENLSEIQKWLQGEAGAHNWDSNIRHVLEIERQTQVSKAEIEERKALMRRKVTTLKRCDLRQTQSLGKGAAYDLVLSAYCVDAATDSKQEWQRLTRNLLSLCADGGTIVLISSRKARRYKIEDKCFPEANVDETDIAEALAGAGFDPQHTQIEVVPIKTWAELAFDGIVIAIAEKAVEGER